MDWLERNFGKMWVGTAIAAVIIGIASLSLTVWAVVSLVNWVVAQ